MYKSIQICKLIQIKFTNVEYNWIELTHLQGRIWIVLSGQIELLNWEF